MITSRFEPTSLTLKTTELNVTRCQTDQFKVCCNSAIYTSSGFKLGLSCQDFFINGIIPGVLSCGLFGQKTIFEVCAGPGICICCVTTRQARKPGQVGQGDEVGC